MVRGRRREQASRDGGMQGLLLLLLLLLLVAGQLLVAGALQSSWAPPAALEGRTAASVAARACPGIDRVSLAELSVERFESDYRGVKPVILTGATAAWGASERWQKAALLRDHGDARVELGHPSEIVAFGGTGGTFSTLGQFIGSFGGNAARDRVIFDSREVLQQRPKLRADFDTPAPFVRMMAEARGGVSWQMLSIGDDGAGLSFHSHGDSWLGIVHGAKRWLLYPPGRAPKQLFETQGPVALPILDWVQRFLPELPVEVPSPLVDCLQVAGEAVYVPAGWLHATLNIGETIGAGGQAHWSATARRDAMTNTPHHDAEVHRNLAIANQNLGQKQLALQHVQRALELGHSEELSLRIALVEALGTAGQRAEALATARRSLALLNNLSTSVGSSGGTAVRSSSSFASFYYALASTMASVGGSAEELEGTFKRALSLAQGTRQRTGGSDALAELRLGQSNAGAVTAGGEESAIACRVAFQLAMGAGKQQRWPEAAMWLREALRVPRALSQQHTTKARKMLPEAEARAAHTVPRDEIAAEAAGIQPSLSPAQQRPSSQFPSVGKRSRRKANAQATRNRAALESSTAAHGGKR